MTVNFLSQILDVIYNYQLKISLMTDVFILLQAFDSVNVCMYLPTPPYELDVTLSQFVMQCLTGLNSEFSFF